jgi:hypothetical protein
METYDYTEDLALSFESMGGRGIQTGHIMKGWFVPPATTRYRFYVACDDYCNIVLGDTPNQIENTTEINNNMRATDFRDWWETTNKHLGYARMSEWIELEEGEPYYIAGKQLQGSGGEHFSTAVEIEHDAMEGHHHSMREVQYLSVEPAQVFDTTRITITNMDEGQFLLLMLNPVDLKTNRTEMISANATADEMRLGVKDYYAKQPNIGSGCSVNRTWYDVNGTETTNYTETVSAVYYITLNRLISAASASSITVVKTTTAATITVDTPADVQIGSLPLAGYYRIECNAEGYAPSYSHNMDLRWGSENINIMMSEGCDQMYDITEVMDVSHYPYNGNGKALMIRFNGINSDPAQFNIVSSETLPLEGTNLTYYSNTTVPYSSNLFYEGIPFDFIRTYETEPQVIVTVNNEPAVCHNLTCGFTYVEAVGEITSFTFDESTKKLVMTGVDLPTLAENITSVEFALSYCTVDVSTISDTTLECTLNQDPTCGEWTPILTSFFGLIPNAADVPAQTVLCSISGAEPGFGLNLLGGDNITISGTNLPHNLKTSTVFMKFSDSQETECIAKSASSS